MANTERYYTHSIVSYASEEEIRRLLDQAKAWAYIKHDKDTNENGLLRETHFHIIATFDRAKSFKQVREMVCSKQNTFTEAIKGEIGDVLDYFTHKGIAEKYHYDEADIVYSDRNYWKRRINNGEDEEDKNEAFMDDLLARDFSAEKMGRKYGRDFIKNYRHYVDFRNIALHERMEELRQGMDGIPCDFDPNSGAVTSINAVLTTAEYQLLQELRFKQNERN